MIDAELFHAIVQKAHDALAAYHLRKALDAVASMLVSQPNWDYVAQLQECQSNYEHLLNYLAKGVDDVERERLVHEIGRKVLAIMEKVRRDYDLANTYTPYVAAYEKLCESGADRNMLSGTLSLIDRFDSIWCSGAWTEDEADDILTYLTLGTPSYEEKALIVSATTLSLLTYFDARKLWLLCQLSREKKSQVRNRAQVGVVLSLACQRYALNYFPDLRAEISALSLDDEVAEELRAVYHAILAAQSTKSACERLAREFERLPMEIPNSEEQAQGQLMGVFRVFMDGQEMGADLNYESFKELHKHSMEFFDSTCNWFWPFTMSHPLLEGVELPSHLNALFGLQRHTHTDRYAFMAMLRRKEVKLQMPEGEEDAERVLSELQITKDEKADIKHYVFDLYRYYTLYPTGVKRHPFMADMSLMHNEELHALFIIPEAQIELIKLYMRAHRYEEAIPLLKRYLEKAPESAWALRSLGRCCYETGKFDDAYLYYTRVLAQTPDNEKIQNRIIKSLILSNREEEALPYLYKYQYNHPDSIDVLRDLSWCLLNTGDISTALGHLHTIIGSGDVQSPDYLNYGHALMAQGELPHAIEAYRKGLELSDCSFDTIVEVFNADSTLLRRLQVSSLSKGLVVEALSHPSDY